DQLLGRHFLEQITVRPGAKAIEDQVGILVGGQDQDGKIRHHVFQFGDAFNAAHARQLDVHDDDVRFFDRKNSLDRFLPARIGVQQIQARFAVQQCHEVFPRAGIVFDDGDGDGHCRMLSIGKIGRKEIGRYFPPGLGSLSETTVPVPEWPLMPACPPISDMRWLMLERPSAKGLLAPGAKQWPLSSRLIATTWSVAATRSQTSVASAWTMTLFNASLTTRKRL